MVDPGTARVSLNLPCGFVDDMGRERYSGEKPPAIAAGGDAGRVFFGRASELDETKGATYERNKIVSFR